MTRGLGRLALALMVVAGCGGAAPSTASAPTATATQSPLTPSPVVPAGPTASATHAATGTPRSWLTDIELLVPQMDKLHPQLDHSASLDDLNAAAHKLATDAPALTDDQLLDGVMHIVATVSSAGCDAHTGAYVWGSNYPVDSLPLRLWLFEDDVYIVDALEPYIPLIGSRIDTIAGVPIVEAIAAVDPLIPRDNEWTVRLLTARYLLIPQVLAGVGIPAGAAVQLSTTDDSGAPAATAVTAIPMADYNNWAGHYGLLLPADPNVLYLSRIDDELWWQDLGDGTLFVQYNEVAFVSHLVGELREQITAAGITRVVLDLRHNTGGEVRALDALTDLFAEPGLIPDGHFFVITGRNTFSAAGLLVARLQANAGATIVGEPMGACPTAWGNSREFKLPFSGIAVDVATQLEIGVAEDDKRSTIEPDIAAPLTQQDWATHRDPALDAITALPK